MTRLLPAIVLGIALRLAAGDTVRPGLEPLERGLPGPRTARITQEELQLVEGLKAPLLEGYDVEKPLQRWFDGRLRDVQGRPDEARRLWLEGYGLLSESLRPLPPPPPRTPPPAAGFVFRESLPQAPGARADVVEWRCGGLPEYGVLMRPDGEAARPPHRLVLYVHGAAFGIPDRFLGWLRRNLVDRGYAVIAPAMRGEPLWQSAPDSRRSGGEIENLDGEVDDCLTMLEAAWRLPGVRPREFAVVGHSFGSGVGLLTAMASGARCKAVVSYDAWLVNPHRYYWDRMRRNANNWLSWADYCNRPVADQLAGLAVRSAVRQAAGLQAPGLFFLGADYAGSVFHQSHDDLFRELLRLGKPFEYCAVAGGGHNFVLHPAGRPAREALRRQERFLTRHYPAGGQAP